ncbi:MAG: hypothetical protein EBR82_86765, partial [Caulobacteraceae bacterium]|nr:hypothetical protein [Caulobacteraceae bacterium]
PPSEMEFAYSIAAYHGTPHDIKGGFQLKYVGTGEGAQAFGWGLYFAENPTVARYYREKLSQGTIPTLDQQLPEIGKSISREAFDFLKGYEDIDAAIQGLRDTASSDSPMIRRAWAGRENELEELNQKYREAADWIEKNKTRLELKRDDGNLYSVEINAEQDEFIDWDKPLSEQSEIIQKALQPFRTDFYDLSVARGTDKESGATAYERIAFALGSREAASRRLFESGIKGVRYLDGTSRGKGAGSNNYVVFDDSLITITARNGEPVDIRESRREDAIPTFSEGSPEASTLSTMKESMAKVDAASEAKPNPENKPTYKISEIASIWMDQGGDTRQLQDMIEENTLLSPANAKRVANAIA